MSTTPKFRVRFEYDPDGRFEECNGEARPLTEEEYAENAYMRDGQPMPYAEYLAYYGNPDRHVYLRAHAQRSCPCCGEWGSDEYLGSIDNMDDSPELLAITIGKILTPAQALTLPGYLRECATDLLQQAGWRPPAHVRCKAKGCTAWHVTADCPVDALHAGTDSGQPDLRYCVVHQTRESRRKARGAA